MPLGASAQDVPPQVIDRVSFDATEVNVARGASLDHGDGYYSYALPEGFDSTVMVADQVVTWAYDGQARFAWAAEPLTAYSWIAGEEEQEASGRGAFLWDLVRVDDLGRRWVVADVDDEAWDTVIADAGPTAADPEPDIAGSDNLGAAAEVEPGTLLTVHAQTWGNFDCNGQNEAPFTPNETHTWEGESRVQVTNPAYRQRAMVRIQTSAGTPICPGVLVRNRVVLTAAHCFTDSNGENLDTSQWNVYRFDDGWTTSIESSVAADDYGGGGASEPKDDWGLLHLDAWSVTPAETMGLSSASDSTLAALDITRALAMPAFTISGSFCVSHSGALFRNQETQPIASVMNNKLRMKIDGAPGHSGSPWFFCPQGDDDACLSGQPGMVYGVHSGFNAGINRMVGAKVSAFRDDALAIINGF